MPFQWSFHYYVNIDISANFNVKWHISYDIFSYFCSKHRLLVLVCTKIYVLEQNNKKKNKQTTSISTYVFAKVGIESQTYNHNICLWLSGSYLHVVIAWYCQSTENLITGTFQYRNNQVWTKGGNLGFCYRNQVFTLTMPVCWLNFLFIHHVPNIMKVITFNDIKDINS